MSNPAVRTLFSGYIKGKRFQVEDNLGEAIHVHIDDLRVSMTVEEYRRFVKAVLDAADQLFALKGLDWNLLDYSSFDWPWLNGYDRIQSIRIEPIKLSELYTASFFLDKPFLPINTKINKSRLYRAFKGDFRGIDSYKQVNMFNVSNRQRLMQMYEHISKNGYPFENKYIMTNQFGLIYDGDHRAVCLMKIHGKDYEIPVIKLVLDNEKSIKEQKKAQRANIFHWIFKTLFNPINLAKSIARRIVKKQDKKFETITMGISFSEFIEKINKLGIKYFIINVPKYDKSGKLIADVNVVVQNGLDDIKNAFGEDIERNPYKDYAMIYSINRPLYYFFESEKISVIVSETLICKSKYEDALLPMDKYVQKYARVNAVCIKGKYYADDCIKCMYILLNSLLESRSFKEEEVLFLKNQINCITSNNFSELMRKELFGFTDYLIELIKKDQFSSIIERYEENINY
ncbi:MAG: hypothetical protein IK057_05025 [Clostridia bacterium]|nr:hypothetical protein [Clostridia bacterium]